MLNEIAFRCKSCGARILTRRYTRKEYCKPACRVRAHQQMECAKLEAWAQNTRSVTEGFEPMPEGIMWQKIGERLQSEGAWYFRLGTLSDVGVARWFPSHTSQRLTYAPTGGTPIVLLPWPARYLIALFDDGHSLLGAPKYHYIYQDHGKVRLCDGSRSLNSKQRDTRLD